ncbi:hypothetical protein A7982_12174 [Minicystis rosea]|nr:hypothetical protein A7982_12174 [Minicystis rosea]
MDILYDNQPPHVAIYEVFQKWAGLEIRYHGEDTAFEELAGTVNHLSQYLCEVCGRSGGYTLIDGWETTLCDAHFEAADAQQKYSRRRDDGSAT